MLESLSCPLCQPESPGPMVFENPHVRIYHSYEGDVPGYLVIQSRRHVTSMSQLSLIEASHFNRAVKKSVSLVEKQFNPDRVYIMSIGEKVHHLHLHVFPRYDWMEHEFRMTGAGLFEKVKAARGSEPSERTRKAWQRLEKLFDRVGVRGDRRMPIQVEVLPYRRTDKGPLFLLLHRIPERGGFWQPVTGGLEEGETLQECALRELFEETGCMDVRKVYPINHTFQFEVDGGKKTLTEYCFAAEVGDTLIRLSKEHENFRWVDLEGAMNLLKWPENKKAIEVLHTMISGLDD